MGHAATVANIELDISPDEPSAGPPRHRPPWALLVVGLVLLLAAGVVAVVRSPGGDDDPSPSPAPRPVGPAIGPEPLQPWASTVNGDRLVVGWFGLLGEADTRIGFIPPDTLLVVADVCRTAASTAGPVLADVSVNGHRVATDTCGPNARTNETSITPGGGDPRDVRAAWRDLGVRPDRPAEIRIRLRSAEGRVAAGARLGVAVYVSTAPTPTEGSHG